MTAGRSRNNRFRGKGAKWTEIDGHKFASRGEAERYLELRTMKARGEIFDFTMQQPFTLQPGFTNAAGEKIRPITYIADFIVWDTEGSYRVEDVKGWGGFTTPEFKLKKKMFEFTTGRVLFLVQRRGKLPQDLSSPVEIPKPRTPPAPLEQPRKGRKPRRTVSPPQFQTLESSGKRLS